VSLIATPTAATWIDLGRIASATGCVTRVAPRAPYEPDTLLPADALVAAPLTFNTLNKWGGRHQRHAGRSASSTSCSAPVSE